MHNALRFMLLLFALCVLGWTGGCAAEHISRRSGGRYAPTNEGRGGTLKYLADGADFIVEQRRADAYKQAWSHCSGPWRIVDERVEKEGESDLGYGTTVPHSYIYIDYECEPQN